MKRTRLRAKPKPSTTDRALAEAWQRAVIRRGKRCVVCGRKRGLQAHHVLRQQDLRTYAHRHHLSLHEAERIRWDVRNGLTVCKPCHDRHTGREKRILREQLPASVFEFVAELDEREPGEPMMVRLENEYPA